MKHMYKFLSLLLLANCTGFSFGKSIQFLNKLDNSSLRMSVIRIISTHILGYLAIGRGNGGMRTWNSLRDETQEL